MYLAHVKGIEYRGSPIKVVRGCVVPIPYLPYLITFIRGYDDKPFKKAPSGQNKPVV